MRFEESYNMQSIFAEGHTGDDIVSRWENSAYAGRIKRLN
jgi:hypothetical protein